MKKILSLLSAGALAVAMISPAMAGGDVDTTAHPYAPRGALGLGHGGGGGFRIARNHHGGGHWRGGHHGNWHGGHHHRGFYNHGGYGWYNGHRGYRHYREGYREYNGWWFPAAILGGAIIGNALAPHTVYRGGSSHVRWCYDHYRSYRASDNTYQPYNGPRRECVSP